MNKEMLLEFLGQDKYQEAYITGAGGTGKTEKLIDMCKSMIDEKITFIVLAYTNKAVEVVKNRVGTLANVVTVHSFLKKRPTINDKATTISSIFTSYQYGEPEPIRVIIVDEFSMLGEDDYMLLGELIDPEGLGEVRMHSIYIGDLSQLSPIKSVCPIVPKAPYWTNLTKIWRTETDLTVALEAIRNMIANETESDIPECDSLTRNCNIIDEYINSPYESKVLVAWTNERVQQINATIQGKELPEIGDFIYDSTLKQRLKVLYIIPLEAIKYHTYTSYRYELTYDSSTKYNPIKTISDIDDIIALEVEDENGYEFCIIGVFGSKRYNNIEESFSARLANANTNKQEKESAMAYKYLKTFKDYIHKIDFTHCLTTHKTQGSQWDAMYVDGIDFNKNTRIVDKLKLFYTALSRAKKEAFLNC